MSSPAADRRLEAELRAMLQRRALDIDPEAPPWRELAQRTGAVVISLRTGYRVDPEPSSTRWRRLVGHQWFRPVLAASVALLVAMAGAIVVRGAGPGNGDTAGWLGSQLEVSRRLRMNSSVAGETSSA